MSGFGKATPRAWKRGVRTKASGSTRDIEADMAQESARFQRLAPTLGWCGHCGVTVDEARGILHGHDCPYLPPERRRAAP